MPQSGGQFHISGTNIRVSVGDNSNVESADGHALVAQGQFQAPINKNMTNFHDGARGKRGSQEMMAEGSGMVESTSVFCRVIRLTKPCVNLDIGSHHKSPTPDGTIDLGSMLEQKLEQLAKRAVTFQVEITPPKKKGEKPEETPCEPSQEHYGNNQEYNFKAGGVYRIWHLLNTEVHLCTFVVLDIQGTNMNCLKIEYCDPDNVDLDFETTHGKLKAERHVPGSYVHRRSSSRLRAKQEEEPPPKQEFIVCMKNQQRLKEDSYIDLANVWNINWQSAYSFVYCGLLQEESFGRVIDIHLHRYTHNLKSRVSYLSQG
jgi:hypothetical protein